MTNYSSSDDEHASVMPAGFDLARRRSSKSPLAKLCPVPYGVIETRPHHIDDIRDCPAYRDWDMFVRFSHDGENGTAVFGVYSRISFPAMSFESEKFLH